MPADVGEHPDLVTVAHGDEGVAGDRRRVPVAGLRDLVDPAHREPPAPESVLRLDVVPRQVGVVVSSQATGLRIQIGDARAIAYVGGSQVAPAAHAATVPRNSAPFTR